MYGSDTIKLTKRMYVVDGRSVDNIAEEMAISPGTINNWRVKYDWDSERDALRDSASFLESSFSFAAYLAAELEKQVRNGHALDKGQLKLFEIIMARTENIIKMDLERKKLEKTESKMEDIPEEVACLPRVQEAVMVIRKAVAEYNRKKQNV